MPSVFDLVHRGSEEIGELAREKDVPNRGSMRKGEKIAALSDEDIHEDLVAEILLSKKTNEGNGLVGKAKDIGVDSPRSHTKAELQELLLKDRLEKSKGSSGPVPESDEDGFDRLPQSECTSHFESAEQRQAAIEQVAQKATTRAIENQATFIVVESFRPKDAKEPLKIQRAYMDRHPDTIVVFEARAPHLSYPIQSAEKNPVYREQA